MTRYEGGRKRSWLKEDPRCSASQSVVLWTWTLEFSLLDYKFLLGKKRGIWTHIDSVALLSFSTSENKGWGIILNKCSVGSIESEKGRKTKFGRGDRMLPLRIRHGGAEERGRLYKHPSAWLLTSISLQCRPRRIFMVGSMGRGCKTKLVCPSTFLLSFIFHPQWGLWFLYLNSKTCPGKQGLKHGVMLEI